MPEMDRDKGKRALEIVEAALDIGDTRDREAFLHRKCGDDEELRQRVEELLSQERNLGAFLEHLEMVGPGDRTAAVAGIADEMPDCIGAYKILGKLGEGGMGVVYLAEQRKPVKRRVALKVIKRGMDTREVIARFEAEKQALALLNHQGIAQVYDAGSTNDGRPYFAMEHIEGVPITDYCDRHRLSIAQRVKLFVQVCEGLEHAHLKGIIHRDIKPSNILVGIRDNEPVAKIIDFGVARATGHRLTDKTLYTEFGRAVGTPAYMSPEQAEMTKESVDHRTDIYSLGALLYELLVGELPLDWEALSKVALNEILRRIREENPPTPSTRWSRLNLDLTNKLAAKRHTKPSMLTEELRGDLDWICMKALEKERERRYRTAAHFADDLERYLNNEPVLARPPSLAYRVRKYGRRNRGPVLAASALCVSLLLGLAASTWFALQSREHEHAASLRAQENLELARLANQRADEVTRLAAQDRVLADLERLDQYESEATELWPTSPARIDFLNQWLKGAEVFSTSTEQHQASLDTLRESDTGYGPLKKLVDRLGKFREPDPEIGTLSQLRRRLKLGPTKEAFTRDWEEAITAIGQDKKYNYLELDIIDGLYPIGRDPESELWEFVHLRTGGVPKRDTTGKLTLTDQTGLVLVLIPGGESYMGAVRPSTQRPVGTPYVDPDAQSDEYPVHKVALSPFLIAKFEVRQCEWTRVMGSNPSEERGDNLPVQMVSWYTARAFCKKLGMELPSEAQWEYACRAGTTTPYSGTGDCYEMGWNSGNAFRRIHPVGKKLPNHYGLYDILGNVLEWCKDVYDAKFYSSNAASGHDPVSSSGSFHRILRGGGVRYGEFRTRSAFRDAKHASDCTRNLGVRPARPYWTIDRFCRQLVAMANELRERPERKVLGKELESQARRAVDFASQEQIQKDTVEYAIKEVITVLEGGGTKSESRSLAFTIAELLRIREQDRQAILKLEDARQLPAADEDAIEGRLYDYREAVLPDLASYASIDDSLTCPTEIQSNETTCCFRGSSKPSNSLEWAEVDFDDHLWQKSTDKLGYGGVPWKEPQYTTVLTDMPGSYTTLYVRQVLPDFDPSTFKWVELRVLADDGVIAYFNGAEVGRIRAGSPGEPLSFNAVASAHVDDAVDPVVFRIDHRLLRRGKNVIALQGLNRTINSSDFLLSAELVGLPVPNLEKDRERFRKFREVAQAEEGKRRVAYLDGRILQRVGRHKEAAAFFRRIIDEDTSRPEPFWRLAECLRALGDEAEAEQMDSAAAQTEYGTLRHLCQLVERLFEQHNEGTRVIQELRADLSLSVDQRELAIRIANEHKRVSEDK